MWLDGSKPNMFRNYPFSESCFTCYTFKVRDKVKGLTYTSISNSMDAPYFVKDASHKCAPGGGGYWKTSCGQGEKAVQSKDPQINIGNKCCIKEGRNGCENKGGICSSAGNPSEKDYSLYNKNDFSCPKGDQSCYVKKDELYSYTNYIRKSGRGGEIFFKPISNQQTNEINYIPGEIYTVSFISPSKQICLKSADNKGTCYAMIGAYAVGLGLGGIAVAKLSFVGATLTTVGKFLLGTAASHIGVTLGAYHLGVLDNLAVKESNWAVGGIGNDVPNIILVSTLNDAKELGCAVDYGEEK